MAVAAYASVLSLLRVLDNIQHPSRLRLFPDAQQIDALREKLCSLQEFLEVHSSTMADEEDIEGIVRKIPRVTYDAEILIDNYLVDRLYEEFTLNQAMLQRINPVAQDRVMLQRINLVIRKIIDHLMCRNFQSEVRRVRKPILNFRAEMDHVIIKAIDSADEAMTTLRTTKHDQPDRVLDKLTGEMPLENRMVGFDDQLNHVLEKLIGTQRDLVIVPIVGMGGIGKTTLARSLFDHPYNLHHFDVRIWLTISQDYSVKRVLQGLLEDGVLGDTKEREGGESLSYLISQLHKMLFGKRFLIVLDDVWSLEAWYDLKRGFPNNGKGSRVIVTTRLSDIAISLGSRNNSYMMKFLDEDKSWDLFREIAFERGVCSVELEQIGRGISKRCRGLPLMLVVIGGLLASSNMKIEYWQTVAKDLNSFASSAYDEHCLRILSLSYHHLPIHLKPCFLFMRHFDEDEEIKVSILIERWVSQGFVKPMTGKTFEETARKYFEDLIGRNMLMILRRDSIGNIKLCGMHDILRNLCVRESEKEQLLDVPRILSLGKGFNDVCFVCRRRRKHKTTLDSKILGSDKSKYSGSISVCWSCTSTFRDFLRSRLVDAVRIRIQHYPIMTTYRGLSIKYSSKVFDTVNLLWNLEIFHARKGSDWDQSSIPWKMPQLRHVKIDSFSLADPVIGAPTVLENLQTLKTVVDFKCTGEIVRRIPNLRKISLLYYGFYGSSSEQEEEWSRFHLRNLAQLRKLESLSIRCSVDTASVDFNAIAFPRSLKKLSLKGCKIAWDDLTIVGSLPNLQVLKLWNDYVSEEWINNPDEGEFTSLRCLELVGLNLARWHVDPEIHFPALESLVLGSMKSLNSIPREIGELPSLYSISLISCHQGIVDSARDIVEEQRSSGNERLVVHVEDFHFRPYQIRGANGL